MRLLVSILVALAITYCFVLLAMTIPATWIDHGPTLCLYKRIVGNECFGCGMTRACFHFLRGEWNLAIGYNWKCIIVAPILFCLLVKQIAKTVYLRL